jgi:hypothetical protein
VVFEVHSEAVEAVRDRRTRRAAASVLRAKHEVINKELRASSEEISESGRALVGLETVILFDSNPQQLLTSLRQFVAAPR